MPPLRSWYIEQHFAYNTCKALEAENHRLELELAQCRRRLARTQELLYRAKVCLKICRPQGVEKIMFLPVRPIRRRPDRD